MISNTKRKNYSTLKLIVSRKLLQRLRAVNSAHYETKTNVNHFLEKQFDHSTEREPSMNFNRISYFNFAKENLRNETKFEFFQFSCLSN